MKVYLKCLMGLLSLLILPAHAAVYQCTIKGVATFSQQPCGEDAEIIIIPETNRTQIAKKDSDKKSDDSVENYISGKKIDRKIKKIERAIKLLQNALSEQKIKIGYMTQKAANRLGAESIADAIEQQTIILEKEVQPKIDELQQQIAALNVIKAQLGQ
ncbi:DUF4124 domain-containing protein [Pseudoalteromonas sp. NEC-BIFX-2020_002]|uniref:DUF4124 domain-containing protein n=1 Tax=Pseudoalteromonas TaxID=53246 RepID=UPI0009EA9D0C|nr:MULTISPECIES: DUF4124 domain-containing protein [Pseudoalteromonas]NNG45319.1 DUF4124 domain-containing protein [Pseudoalteromonas sp. NEC-BIFX-2020_002]